MAADTKAASSLTGDGDDMPPSSRAKRDIDNDTWSNLVHGDSVRGKGKRVILDHCAPDELPRFVIGAGPTSGALAVFEDRCMIVKAGGLTGFMTGATFGARVATFNFQHVTGIEYNGGLLNGVLEILTPSYHGGANKDFWRGTFQGRNADSNDPFTLSNTLPLDRFVYRRVRDQIDELRRLATTAIPAVPVAPLPASTPIGLAHELRELAALRDDGLLSDTEFEIQRQRLLEAA